MINQPFHIIAFDVPYPPNYGGIIDVFYKLKTLHQLGAKIIFHCFYYTGHNPPTNELEKYCDTIYYYERKKHISKLLLSKYPYIIASRNNKALLNNLLKDNNPILFEGLQSCFYLSHPSLKNRKKIVRAHNIEHKYYSNLAKSEKNKLKQVYLKWEAKKLFKFEKELKHCQNILSIAKMDVQHFNQYANTTHIPPFFNQSCKDYTLNLFNDKPFILFQGNLSVSENENAVNFILEKIVPFVKHQFIIAGKDPSTQLQQKISSISHVKLIANPSQEMMNELIENAQINLLFTFQQTGIKLKLLHALELGQHIIINSKMDDSGIFEPLCVVEDDPQSIIHQINQLITTPFTKEMFDKRQSIFNQNFDNKKNGQKVLEIIF